MKIHNIKTFPQCPEEIPLPDYKGKNATEKKSGSRHYFTPKGTMVPSVSTVMGYDPEKIKTLNAWRKRVGKEKAAHITNQSCGYGNVLHDCLEKYLENDVDSLSEAYTKAEQTPRLMFSTIKEFVDKHVEKVFHQEKPVYSERLGVAGRLDVLCQMNGMPTLLDFKNSRRPKRKAWVHGYCLQASCYAEMVSEHSGIDIKYFVIPIACFSGELQVVTGKVSDYRKEMVDQIRRYYDEVYMPNEWKV